MGGILFLAKAGRMNLRTDNKGITTALARGRFRGFVWMIGLFFALMFVGCATKSSPKAVGAVNQSATTVVQSAPPNSQFNNQTQPYRLQVADEIEIKFHLVPELNDQVTVRPDGKISLQVIDEVDVLDLTPSELDKLLTKKYGGTLRNPDLTVIVRKFSGQKVFVGGEVKDQGMVPINGRLTVIQAIMQAGGFTNTAEMGNVVLLRNQGKENPHFAILNLAENLNDPMGGLASNGVVLQPYDVVFVPKSTIATMDQFVDQYINQLVPKSVQFGFQWLWNVGGGSFAP